RTGLGGIRSVEPRAAATGRSATAARAGRIACQKKPAAIENAATPEPEIPNIAEPEITATPAGNKPPQAGFTGSLFDHINEDARQPGVSAERVITPETQVEPLLTLYDLLGFSAEERSQVNRPRRRKPKPKATKPPVEEERVIEWREELMIARHERLEAEKKQQESTKPQPRSAGTSDATAPEAPQIQSAPEDRPDSKSTGQRKIASGTVRSEPTNAPKHFLGPILEHYREGSLVADEE
ncbi:hypothetical protein OBE_13074, partial [human gut metagenome]